MTDFGGVHLDFCRKKFTEEFLPRLLTCLDQLSDEDIWWRPNEASNSAGNIVLHLSGNVRQWIISSIGGEKDVRKRQEEFDERGPIPREVLVKKISDTIRGADAVLAKFDTARFGEVLRIQVFDVTCLEAITHVMEHFSYHLGQIVYITKLRNEKDLRFYDL